MELVHIFLVFSVGVIFVTLTTGKPDPPKDVRIHVIGRKAKISWLIPTNIEGARFSRLYIKDSKNGDIYLNKIYKSKDIPIENSTFEIDTLTMCSKYYVRIQFVSPFSEFTTQQFWMTNKIFTADVNQNVTLSWTTSLTDFFSVRAASSEFIYVVQGGYIIHNLKDRKYIFDNMPQNVKDILITVIRVNTTDAGLYSTEESGKVDTCCLLVVTAKPVKPTLTIQPEHPFVGDNITITCNSMVQRWPGYLPSHLLYHFIGNTRGESNNSRLTINNITKLDKGTIISCKATDDLGKRSIMGDSVTLDPYYGPENVEVEPTITNLNVTEGTTLGPLYCIATCNPGCNYNWKQKWTGTFNPVPNEYIFNQGRGVRVQAINRSQTGKYNCRVDHSTGYLHNTKEISVNVQYSPKITDIWFSGGNQRKRLLTPFSFNEEENAKMTLRVESNPDSKIMFRSSLLKIQQINKGNGYTDYTCNLPFLKCEDSGNFSILARNGIPYADTSMVNLKIHCKPRNVSSESRTIGAKIGSVEDILLRVISFPAPNVRWERVTGFAWTIEKDIHDYRHKIHSEIRIGSENNFGVYGIRICNQFGCIVENITLKPQDKPEAPQNISVVTTTFRSVNISWIAGFNGGHEQTFSVQFKATDDVKWNTKSLQNNDIKTGSTIYYTLYQLKPDTSYQVVVVSNNLQGQRNASLEFKTEDKPEAPQNISVVTTTFRSVNISWIAGFNGGHEQTFSVQFKATDDVKWDKKNVENDDIRTGSTIYYTLDQLRPDTSYQVTVVSKNIQGQRNASLEFKTEVEPILSSSAPPNSASISHLTVGLVCGIPPLLVVCILLVYIGRRNKYSKSDLKEKNVKSEKSDEYTIIQRNNPTFTDAYSTLQSPTESTALPTESMETNTYDECGVLANVEVYETMDDRKIGNVKDEEGSGQEKSKERMYDNMKI